MRPLAMDKGEKSVDDGISIETFGIDPSEYNVKVG